MNKKSKRRRSKKRRPDFIKKHLNLLTLLVMASLALLSLLLMARSEKVKKETALPTPQFSAPLFQQLDVQIVNSLKALGVSDDQIQKDFEKSPNRYDVVTDVPVADIMREIQNRFGKMSGHYSIQMVGENSLILEFSSQTMAIINKLPVRPLIPEGPLLTIIMDDLGRSATTALTLVEMDEKVTFAILPEETQAANVAEIGHLNGHEILLHLPMEPQGYPAVNPGENALFVNLGPDEIQTRLNAFLEKVPYVSGTNNHMGSRFTEDYNALLHVMQLLRQRGLFFVDSLTTGNSQVAEAANRIGVPTLKRDVFLDNVADVDAIVKEIQRLVTKAVNNGAAIGICHPYPETLLALQKELPKMKSKGITVVPVATLLQKKQQRPNHQ